MLTFCVGYDANDGDYYQFDCEHYDGYYDGGDHYQLGQVSGPGKEEGEMVVMTLEAARTALNI